MAEIYLLRHGEALHNLTSDDIVGGRSSEAPLTNRGHEQAYLAGAALVKQEVLFDAYASSTALRAQQTMRGVLSTIGSEDIDFATYSDLEEMTQGVADGKPRRSIYTPEVEELISLRGLDFAIPGAETIREVGTQGLRRITSLAREHPESSILVIAHGLRIRALVGMALGWDHAQILSAKTPNCSLTHATISDDQFLLHTLGEDIIKSA